MVGYWSEKIVHHGKKKSTPFRAESCKPELDETGKSDFSFFPMTKLKGENYYRSSTKYSQKVWSSNPSTKVFISSPSDKDSRRLFN